MITASEEIVSRIQSLIKEAGVLDPFGMEEGLNELVANIMGDDLGPILPEGVGIQPNQ